MEPRAALSEAEQARYEGQLWVPGFGEEGQKRLNASSVLVSRIGGVGGMAAYHLAAAGVGRLVLAHAGNVKPSDLNRQLLMTQDWVGKPRVQCAALRLQQLNPFVEVIPILENVGEENVERLVEGVDLIVDGAPLFSERLLLNREAVRQRKPLVECALYDLDAQLTTIVPGRTPCLACLYPEETPAWKRELPVLGAVSGTIGSLGALEAIKVLAGLGEPLLGRLLLCDLRTMTIRQTRIHRRPDCTVCGRLHGGPP
jgi:molybdopterin/thiamine biosynthesis adenylyltransferase